MFGKRFDLFKLFGFQIRVDISWFFIAILITWSLAMVFKQMFPGLDPSIRWTMGVIGAMGLFGSVILHEIGHSLVAREYGLPIKGITLFIFGGVAEMQEEPKSAKAEFFVAIAGPIVSVLIAITFSLLSTFGQSMQWPNAMLGVTGYLALVNTILVLFNLIPAFPLDGGRVLRSALWYWKDNLRWATKITTQIGAAFGLLFILLGVIRVISGDFIGGLWWCLIGLFLRSAALMSYQQLLIRRALEGEPIHRFMRTNPITVPPEISIEYLVENYVYRHHYKMYPVVQDGELKGCITTRAIKELEREEWPNTSARDLLHRCSPHNTVGPNDDAMQVMAKMNRTGASRMMVVETEQLKGIISLKDLMGFLANKIELEEDGDQSVMPTAS